MAEQLSIEVIHDYDIHRNIPWNILEYQPLREYVGKSKTPTSQSYITKKGSFMDPHIANVKDLPSPDRYACTSSFNQEKNKAYSHRVKINPRLKKNTYLDQIAIEGKKSKIGVGSYNLKEPEREKVKHPRSAKSARVSFCQHAQYSEIQKPGAGAYNPHLEVKNINKDRTSPDMWRKKHQKESRAQAKEKKKIPGPSSYRPASAGTFARKELDIKKDLKKNPKSLNKGFGTDAKFEYCRPSKKKIVETRPTPTKYDLSIPWKGKADSTKNKGWASFLSTRSASMSVYH